MLKYVVVFATAITGVAFAQVNVAVPSSLLVVARRSPWELAMLLANASVPSGLELRDIDDVPPLNRPDFNLARTPRVPASDLVRAFDSQHSDYRAILIDGVFVIRPVDRPVRFLDEPSSLTSPIAVTGILTAARRIFSPLDPALSDGRGIMGSFINVPPEELGENLPITVDGGRRVIDDLNQIVRQSARMWYVVTRRRPDNEWQIVRFGFIQTQGVTIDQGLSLPRKD